MKISKFISELEKIKNIHGDLEVETDIHHLGGRQAHPGPQIAHRGILYGRESKPRFSRYESDRDEKVCKI